MEKVYRLPQNWVPVSIAPPESDLEVCVIDKAGVHALIFPCRKAGNAWMDASTREPLDIQPTHWRLWSEDGSKSS
jgi:hypothetical protein